jgi:hypothetical protein
MNRFQNSVIHFCICVVVALPLSFTACMRDAAKPLCLVFIIDLTRNIEAESQRQAFDAIQASLKELKRGDSITIIPITGDTMTQAQGCVIRFRLADKREAYDEDLNCFAQQVNERLQRLREETGYAITVAPEKIQFFGDAGASVVGNIAKSSDQSRAA